MSRTDDVNNAAALISATPIISAEAVRAVRRGDRMALSRAILPAGPNAFWIGAPMAPATGRATVVDRLAMPMKINSAPPPARAIRPNAPPGLANSPTTNIAAPTASDDAADDQSPAGGERGVADLGAHRRHRWHLAGAPGREDHARHRDADADDQRDDHGRWSQDQGR